MKQLRVIALSALNAMQIGLTIFIAALIISSVATALISTLDAVIDTNFLLSILVISGVFGLIAFLATCPFCYMNGKKGKSYPFIKFNIKNFFEVLSRAFFEGF